MQKARLRKVIGSLGIPRIGGLSTIGTGKSRKELLFYDTRIHNCIENAFQALALDESRSSYSPAVWEKPRGNTTVRSPTVISLQDYPNANGQ